LKYQEFSPSEALRPYIKCYYLSESGIVTDTAFATGCIEMMFNLGGGRVELWGQIIRPLTFRWHEENTMLGIRFYPHTAFLFLDEEVSNFNDQVTDFTAVAGKPLRLLHERLLETSQSNKRFELLDKFLLAKLYSAGRKLEKLPIITNVMHELMQENFFDNLQQVASRYGISSRYLQKLFVQYTGLSPKLYQKINRFQKSLVLVGKGEESLTSIAYECGYYDQSHFIRDFKTFTGYAPSSTLPTTSAILASPYR
jgi:AraC-like DNA-binding protein